MRGVEQIPAVYDAMFAVLERFGLDRWRAWLVRGATGRVLEVGCGTGRNLPLYPPGARVVAVDPDPDVLRRAKARAPGIPLIRASAEALPFKDGAFDTVVSGLVFCSVDDPAAALGEVRRVLTRDGMLRMLEHVRSTSPAWGWVQDRIAPAWTAIAGGCRPNRDTEKTVAANGFEIDPDSVRADGTMRRFAARKRA